MADKTVKVKPDERSGQIEKTKFVHVGTLQHNTPLVKKYFYSIIKAMPITDTAIYHILIQNTVI